MGMLDGKVAIVTGGAGGIGSATARRLASGGASVVVADRDGPGAQTVADAIGNGAIAIDFDAADPASVTAMVERTIGHFGRLDVLHNNAGVTREAFGVDNTVIDTDLEVWDRTMAINVRSMFVACKAAVPQMLSQGGGSIINTASAGGVSAVPALIAYGTSKGAVITFTRYLAVQHGRENVRSNAILPGLILTAMITDNVPDPVATFAPNLPFHRGGRAEDVAGMVAYLASDEAQFINGATLMCDGGNSAGVAPPVTANS